MRDLTLLADLGNRGMCCSQMMVYMGLEQLGRDNPMLLQAVSGLCKGMRNGLTCGALTGAVCMLGMFGDSTHANSVMVPELVEWFTKQFMQKYGSINCLAMLEDDISNRHEKCPAIIEKTYLKAKDILRDNGFNVMDNLPD